MGLSEAISALLSDDTEPQCDLAIELIKAHKRTRFVKTKSLSSEHQLEISQPKLIEPIEVQPAPAAESAHKRQEYVDFVCSHVLSQYPAGKQFTYAQLENLFIQEATIRNWLHPGDYVQLSESKPRWKIRLSDALTELSKHHGLLTRLKGTRTYVLNVF